MNKIAKEIPDDASVLVAVDDGYAQVKVAYHMNGKTHRFVTPTSISASMEGVTEMDGSNRAQAGDALGWYETEGRRYTAGARVSGEETRFASFHVSSLNRIAVHHAIIGAAGLGGHAVQLVAGLPVSDYYVDGAINQELIDRKIANLKTPVRTLAAQARPIRIDHVRMVAQAVASFVDFVITDELHERTDMDITAPIGVIDIGGRTTDCAVVIDGSKIEHRRSGTENIGVIDVRADLARSIAQKWKGADHLPAAALNLALETGIIRLFGQDCDVCDLLRSAVHRVTENIFRAVERHLSSVADLEKVLIVGGGANIFTDLAGRFPNGVVVDHPEFANVSGMLKYGRMREVQLA